MKKKALFAIIATATLAVAPACGDDGGAALDASQNLDGSNGGGDGGGGGLDGGGSDGGSGIDSGTAIDGGGSGTITCGDSTCDMGTQECCYESETAMCVDEGTCGGATATCDGPEDCEGSEETCCAELEMESATASCEMADNCEFEVCHTMDDCPDGEMCCEASGIVPYKICSSICFM